MKNSEDFEIVFKKIKSKWIDLGLPSGNLWKNINENGYFTYDDTVEKFKDNLPTIVDFAELVHYCQWKWSSKLKGMVIIGPNKNQIIFPVVGFYDYDSESPCDVGDYGCYLSKSCEKSNIHLSSEMRTLADFPVFQTCIDPAIRSLMTEYNSPVLSPYLGNSRST